jgi:DNA-binding MarR family transcriptional regulator
MSRTPRRPLESLDSLAPTGPTDTPARVLHELGEAAGLLEQVMADRLGLARSDLVVASILAVHGPRSAGQLAEATGLTTGAVTGSLDRLERVGFARRSADPGDRRRVIVTLREERLGPVVELNEPLVRSLRAIDAEYDPAQRALLADYVRRAAGQFRAEALRLRAEGRHATGKKSRKQRRPSGR